MAAAGITAAVIFSGTDSYRVLKVFELNGTAAVERESAGELDAYVGMNLESGDVITVNSGSVRLSLDNSKVQIIFQIVVVYVQVLRIRRDRLRPVINIAPVNACVRIIEA